MKKIIPFIIVLLFTLTTGCHRQQVDAEQHRQDSLRLDSQMLKIGYLPTLESLPLLIAQQQHYLDSSKIKLIRFEAGMDLDTALLNNRVQCITSDLCRTMLMNSKDSTIKSIGNTQNIYKLITAQKQRIRKPKDLAERMIAIARNEISDYLLDAMLKHEQLDPALVNRPQINALSLRRQMLLFEELDAALLPEPFATECLVNGDRCLMTNIDIDSFISCLTINKQASENYAEQVKMTVQAYNEAVDYLQNNKPDLLSFYELSKEVADTLEVPHYDKLSLPREKDIENVTQWLQERNLISGKKKTTCIEERFLNK